MNEKDLVKKVVAALIGIVLETGGGPESHFYLVFAEKLHLELDDWNRLVLLAVATGYVRRSNNQLLIGDRG